jgi:hypothetical protein
MIVLDKCADHFQYFNVSCEFLVFMTDDFFPHHVIECVQIVFVDDALNTSDVIKKNISFKFY